MRDGGGRTTPVSVAEEGPPVDGSPVFLASELDVHQARIVGSGLGQKRAHDPRQPQGRVMRGLGGQLPQQSGAEIDQSQTKPLWTEPRPAPIIGI